MSLDWCKDVFDFHDKFGCHIGSRPECPDADTERLRKRLMEEELNETFCSMDDEYLAGVADGIVDLVYVALGTLVSYGIDPRPIWDAVHEANMAKEGGATREDGKILKPPGWVAPDVEALLEQQAEKVYRDLFASQQPAM